MFVYSESGHAHPPPALGEWLLQYYQPYFPPFWGLLYMLCYTGDKRHYCLIIVIAVTIVTVAWLYVAVTSVTMSKLLCYCMLAVYMSVFFGL